MAKQLKKWQGWLLFGGAMVVVFVLGLLCSSLLERRAEVASIFNNRRTPMTDSIVAQNEKFAEDFPREYQSWAMTEDTTFESKYNGSQEKSILEKCPEIVIIWDGSPSQETTTPHVDTAIALKTCAKSCARVLRALMVRRIFNPEHAGLARVLTCHG